MKTHLLKIAVFLTITQSFHAHGAPVIGAIPPGTTVRITYTASKSKDVPKSDDKPQFTHTLYKGRNVLIETRIWPDKRTTYDVRINNWRFYTDPTVPDKYRDHVQAIQIQPGIDKSTEFSDLTFVADNVVEMESHIRGKAAILLTCPPAQTSRMTQERVDQILSRFTDPAERAEMEKDLKQVLQKQKETEKERESIPPNRVWLESSTRLPIQAEVSGSIITFSYSAGESAPPLPSFFIEAIEKQLGKLPAF